MGEWINEWMNEWMNEWIDWMNEWTNERTNEWMNEWMNEYLASHFSVFAIQKDCQIQGGGIFSFMKYYRYTPLVVTKDSPDCLLDIC